jgi:hypothetical protein
MGMRTQLVLMICVVDVFCSAAWEHINNAAPDFEVEQIIMSFGRVLDFSI